MSVKVKKYGGYGDGARGEAVLSSGQINSYAPVTKLAGRDVTIGAKNQGTFDDFAAGVEILLHVSATKGSQTSLLGEYAHARIKSVSGSVLTLDRPLEWTAADADTSSYYIQAVTVPNFTKAAITGILLAAAFSTSAYCGGILALKCSADLVFQGGRLDVSGRGIPVSASGLRPALSGEATEAGKLFIHSELPAMNKGNGVVMLCAKRITFDATAVIGGTAYGDPDAGSGDGGASIQIVTDETVSFRPEAISTGGVTSGVGRGRCRIVTRPEPACRIPSYELLYGHDLIHDPAQLRKLGFRNFGDGRYKSVTNPTAQICSYAAIHRIDADLKTIEANYISAGAYAPLEEGALVMFHVSGCRGAQVLDYGRYCIRQIASRTTNGSNTIYTLDKPLPVHAAITADYYCQLAAVAQFETLTLRDFTMEAPAWSGKGCGAILAVACTNMLNMYNSKILTKKVAFDRTYPRRPDGIFQTNAVAATRMMLGQGNGGILLLCKNIVADASSRVGGEQDPMLLEGIGGTGFVSPIPYGTTVPDSANGKGGGSGFAGGGAAPAGDGDGLDRISIPSGTKSLDGNKGSGSSARPMRSEGMKRHPGHAGYSRPSQNSSPFDGFPGSCIVAISETQPSELEAVMSSGGQGGRKSGGNPNSNTSYYLGGEGGGSGQLMFFHVGGDAA